MVSLLKKMLLAAALVTAGSSEALAKKGGNLRNARSLSSYYDTDIKNVATSTGINYGAGNVQGLGVGQWASTTQAKDPYSNGELGVTNSAKISGYANGYSNLGIIGADQSATNVVAHGPAYGYGSPDTTIYNAVGADNSLHGNYNAGILASNQGVGNYVQTGTGTQNLSTSSGMSNTAYGNYNTAGMTNGQYATNYVQGDGNTRIQNTVNNDAFQHGSGNTIVSGVQQDSTNYVVPLQSSYGSGYGNRRLSGSYYDANINNIASSTGSNYGYGNTQGLGVGQWGSTTYAQDPYTGGSLSATNKATVSGYANGYANLGVVGADQSATNVVAHGGSYGYGGSPSTSISNTLNADNSLYGGYNVGAVSSTQGAGNYVDASSGYQNIGTRSSTTNTAYGDYNVAGLTTGQYATNVVAADGNTNIQNSVSNNALQHGTGNTIVSGVQQDSTNYVVNTHGGYL